MKKEHSKWKILKEVRKGGGKKRGIINSMETESSLFTLKPSLSATNKKSTYDSSIKLSS